MVIMENPTNKLTFRWTGDEKGKEGMELMLAFGNQQIGPIPYAEEHETEIPISGGPMEIKVLCGQNGKHKTWIKHTFQFEHGKYGLTNEMCDVECMRWCDKWRNVRVLVAI